MVFKPKPPKADEKWSNTVLQEVRDGNGDVSFRITVEWPTINPAKVGLIQDLLAKSLVDFKKLASSV